jgi:hypothetical protein
MRPERAAITVKIHLPVIKVVAALRVSTKFWVVLVPRQNKRSSASPSSHQLGGDQFLLFRCFAILSQEIAKCSNVFLKPHIGDIAAVARKNLRLRQPGRRSIFIRIAEKKFSCTNRRTRAGRWLTIYSLDVGLRQTIAIPEVLMRIGKRRNGFQIERG